MLTLLLFAALSTSAPNVEVTALNGQTASGELVELAGDHLLLKTTGGDRAFKLTELLAVVPKPDAARPKEKAAIWVELIDGSRLAAKDFQVTKGTAKIGLTGGRELAIPTRVIHLVQFSPHDAPPAWIADLKADTAGDLIVVRKRDNVDFIEGAAENVTAEVVRFTVDGETIDIKRAKVEGLVYAHPNEDALPEPTCAVQGLDGTRLKAKSVTLSGADLQVASLVGRTVTIPLSAVQQIDLSMNNVVYVGDLTPESSEWTPLLDFGKQAASLAEFYRPLENRGREGGLPSLAGKKYNKALSLYSRTERTYKLPAKSQRFKALAGIDDAVRDQGNVRLVIRGDDDKTLFQGNVTGRDPPLELDLDVTGVKRLHILVDYGDDLDVGDYLDLCDARIVK